MAAAERARRGVTIVLSSSEQPVINATIGAIRRVFPHRAGRRFVIVREVSEEQAIIEEQIESSHGLSPITLLTTGSINYLRGYASLSDDTLRAIAPDVLIVAQQSESRQQSGEMLTPHRGFRFAKQNLLRAKKQNTALQESINYDFLIGIEPVAFSFPEGELPIDFIGIEDREGRQSFAMSGGVIFDRAAQESMVYEREKLLEPSIVGAFEKLVQ